MDRRGLALKWWTENKRLDQTGPEKRGSCLKKGARRHIAKAGNKAA